MPYKSSKEIEKETPLDCYGTNEIVCPHCFYKHRESCDYHDAEGSGFDMECEECGKGFWVDIEYEISYFTWAHKEISPDV